MKAVICPRYGPPEVLRIEEVETPIPADDEILVRVRSTTVTAGDYRVRGLNVPTGFGAITRLAMGFTGPRNPILGMELAGEVVAVGPEVSAFRVGDDVMALAGAGAHAEYIALPQDGAVVRKPATLSHDEAAALPFGGHTALYFLRRAGIRPGQRVLVYGASGNVGTAAVQLAKHYGAEVTGVCSGRNVELVRSLGADAVIDYTAEDPTSRGEEYDIIMEIVGKTSFSRWKGSLRRGGRYIMVTAGVPGYLRLPWNALFGSRKIIAGVARGTREDLQLLQQLAEKGELVPVIDRRYPLERIVDAHRYAEQGHKTGSVVITLEGTG